MYYLASNYYMVVLRYDLCKTSENIFPLVFGESNMIGKWRLISPLNELLLIQKKNYIEKV